MTDPTTSIEFWIWDTVHESIRQMAREKVFRRVGEDSLPHVSEHSVIKRFNRRPSLVEDSRTGETSFPVPGFVVTYLGHVRPVSLGENSCDDGIVRILVQVVDDGDDGDATNAASYIRWLNDIREFLQESSDGLSPLEDCPSHLGQVYMVHVGEMRPPDETDWANMEKMRMGMIVECYTRTER